MRITGADAVSNQSVEIVQIVDGIRLTTGSAAINIPAVEITDFSFDPVDSQRLNLTGPVSMQIKPDDPEAAALVVASVQESLPAPVDVGESPAGLFDHHLAEPAAGLTDSEDTSAYTPPHLPASAIPPPSGPVSQPPTARNDVPASTEGGRVSHRVLLKTLLASFVGVFLIGTIAAVTRTLTIDDSSITVAERTAGFFSSLLLTLAFAVLTLQTAILVRFVAALRYDEAPRTLPLIGPLTPTFDRATALSSRAVVIVSITVGLAVFAAAAAVVDDPLSGALWLSAGLVLASLILALATTIDQLQNQLDGSIDLGGEHRT